MLDPAKIEEAIALYDQGDTSSKNKAFAIVRTMIRGIRSTKECEVQIAQWKKQRLRAQADLPEDMSRPEEEATAAQALRDIMEAATRFDNTVIALIGLKRDAKHAHFGEHVQLPAQSLQDLCDILKCMERLMESNINPTSALLALLQSVREHLIKQDGKLTIEVGEDSLMDSVFSSDLEPKVCYDVSKALKKCNLLHDILAHM